MKSKLTADQVSTLYNLVDDFIREGQVPDGEQGFYLDLRETLCSLHSDLIS